MGTEISPVWRPGGSWWQFWAPSWIGEPARISDTAASAVNGGHTATWTPRGAEPVSHAGRRAPGLATVPCIFQLPMTEWCSH